MKQRKICVAFFSLLAFLTLLSLSACLEENEVVLKKNQILIETQDGETHLFDVEFALTGEQQAQGLMHREAMPENAGMLFYFGDKEAERGFWMKNTLIPLDMIFIKVDGTIHHIHKNAKPHDLTTIRSNGPVAAVFEINGGRSAQLGIKVGDVVRGGPFSDFMIAE